MRNFTLPALLTGTLLFTACGPANLGGSAPGGSPIGAMHDNQTTHQRENHGTTERDQSERAPASASGNPQESASGASELVSPEKSNQEKNAQNPKDAKLPRDDKGIVGSRTANHTKTKPAGTSH